MGFDADALQQVTEKVGKTVQTIQNGMETVGKSIGSGSVELFNKIKNKMATFGQDPSADAKAESQGTQNNK